MAIENDWCDRTESLHLEGGTHGGTTQQIWCNSHKPDGFGWIYKSRNSLAIVKPLAFGSEMKIGTATENHTC